MYVYIKNNEIEAVTPNQLEARDGFTELDIPDADIVLENDNQYLVYENDTVVKKEHSPEEFKTHYDRFAEQMKEIGTEFYEKNIEVISEEYISGPQYSVNVYIDADQNITFCPISRVVTPQELGTAMTGAGEAA